ncbi:MAG: preprotein translocase subunit SecY [Cytophagales bacterium]|jgi:preprotein translocase subunit SecY|nr:preprotein translocase subunit SecY [Cytophagales bacterium]
MKKIIQTIKNIFSIEDLRTRIINTMLLLLIFRLGAYIVLPGIDPTKLDTASSGGVLGLLNTFLGGAFSNASIFALGIMPYITASIIVQLLTVAVPYFQKMQKEGESGRQKINRITRILTILVTLPQSYTYLVGTIADDAILPGVGRGAFTLSAMIILTTGTMFCMWLGERITEKGIGNGTSMLIMIGIISRLPGALVGEFASRGVDGILFFILEMIALFFIVVGVVMVLQATRRIPIQYAKQVVGNRVYGGQRQYLPLKLTAAGVMPIIFAQSLMFLPGLLVPYLAEKNETAGSIAQAFSDFTNPAYNILFALLIILFSFFYTAITVNPTQIADEMKRNGGFIPGVKPGVPTAYYIDTILSRITLPGAIFLALLAVLPAIASLFGITSELAGFYGGTSLLIMVGVILDTLQQIESYLLMRHYEGLMKSGRVKGRSESVATV